MRLISFASWLTDRGCLLVTKSLKLMQINEFSSMLQLRPVEEDESAAESLELNRAVADNDHSLLAELLSQERYRKCINHQSGWGIPGTPLRMAASKGHLRCLQLLLAHGAEVDRLDVKAQTPLFTAVCGRYLSCVLALLRAGANPNGSHLNNSSPVLTAAREGDPEILRQLLQHGAEVNARSKVTLWASGVAVCSGPLYLSAIYEHLDCFKMLLLYGADPNYNSPEGKVIGRATQQKTVLELCLRHGCGVEYIQLLIDFGANVYLLAIRRHLIQVNKIQSLDSLEIPPRLIDYLKHNPMNSALVY
uniref:Ankyrin repeat and SOCS box-containing 12a n=1 Tax=Cyprinus carpio TaxID=7962 RepID=A0A8C2FHZ0_CYPCA